MKKHTLKAQNREIFGHKVKNLRKTGLVPATIYGKHIKSIALSVLHEEFASLYKEVGESSLVELSLDSTVHPVLIHNVQKHPVDGHILHVEFFQVDLKEKVRTNVPIEVTGESPAIKDKLGVYLTILDEVEVEALPANLPEHLTLDISVLSAVEQELKVKDIVVPQGVVVVTASDLTVSKIAALVTKEAEAQVQEEATQAAAQAEQSGTPAELGTTTDPQKEEVKSSNEPTESK